MGTEAIIAMIFGLIDRAAQYTALVSKARAEGRTVSAAEWEAVQVQVKAAEARELAAINKALAEGR